MGIALNAGRTSLAGLLVAAALLGTAGGARAAGALDRERALKMIGSSHLEQRRQGYGLLADAGEMEDTPVLLSALLDDEDLIRGVAEQSLWGLWMRANDPVADPMFQMALDLLHQAKLAESEEMFDRLLEMKPEFAEGWHRRGEVKVAGERWDAAAADFSHALELNPYHFGALEGLGHCSLRRGRNAEAVGYFRRALELNPNLDAVREALRRASIAAEGDRT